MQFKDWLQIGVSAGALITMLFVFYKSYREPDIKADKNIDLLKQGCQLRHSGIDKDLGIISKSIAEMQRSFSLLQENDLKHIETRMTDLEKGQIEIKTILNERLPKK